ncbi:phosphatidate cytidylyltransferase [Micromonospora sp. KC606]|uniref:phosphatidate cytidylyltransferase n=1 Tax=Micromonospora sp. KC606 TaxID=2530379 RepID=UPI001053CAA1|nr:phosphatidate cytidylyltransferase [Micromonospora sp. KC606]TDC79455.1 phosphatidate cytidylyltransferase [Micromonospora sp. KC606]
MSHPDPYGGIEPRSWDRPERPSALPWPGRDVEPWSRQPASELYAGPQSRSRPHDRRPDGADADPDEPYRNDRGAPYGPRDDNPARPPGGARDRAGDGRYDHGPSGPPASALSTGPAERPGAGRGWAGPFHDDAPTAAFPPVRDDGVPAPPFASGREDAAPAPRFAHGRDDEASTSPFVPVRDDDAPTVQIPPVPAEVDEEPRHPPARRSPGKRRASAERPPTQQPAASRAGRNLPAAIGVGLALGALILVPLFFYPPAFLAVVAAAVGVGIWEMVRAVRRSDAHPPLVPLVAGGVLTVGLAWFAGPDALSLGLLVTVLGTMIWRLGDGPAGFQRDITAATLIAVYVPFLGGFAALLAAAPDDGDLRVLVTLVAVVLSDTGGYAAGVTFGKHPMAPSISPKKSWEGFAGSVTAAAAGSAGLVWLLLDVSPWWGALFGLAVSGAAVLGDLAESMIKRDLGVKDMSNLLPGHGGLMDRLDSILFAVPTAYLLLAVFVPVVG